jgi:hypothetical protein
LKRRTKSLQIGASVPRLLISGDRKCLQWIGLPIHFKLQGAQGKSSFSRAPLIKPGDMPTWFLALHPIVPSLRRQASRRPLAGHAI